MAEEQRDENNQPKTYPIIDEINELESQIETLTYKRYELIGQAKAAFHQHVKHLLQNGTDNEISKFVSEFYWGSGKVITISNIRAAVTDMKFSQYIIPAPVNAICSRCKEVYTVAAINWDMYLNVDMSINWRGTCPSCCGKLRKAPLQTDSEGE